jgi:hypothetical protein
MMVSLRQNGVGHDKTCADAFLPKGHESEVEKLENRVSMIKAKYSPQNSEGHNSE